MRYRPGLTRRLRIASIAFLWLFKDAGAHGVKILRQTLDEHPRFDLSSNAAKVMTTMLITHTNQGFQGFLAEAASVASVLPCWQSFDEKRRPGYVLALAGSCAR
jgi:hypothetical protein